MLTRIIFQSLFERHKSLPAAVLHSLNPFHYKQCIYVQILCHKQLTFKHSLSPNLPALLNKRGFYFTETLAFCSYSKTNRFTVFIIWFSPQSYRLSARFIMNDYFLRSVKGLQTSLVESLMKLSFPHFHPQ